MNLLRIAAAPAAGIVASVLLLVQAHDLSRIAPPGQLGPGFWPTLILVGLGIACTAKLIVELACARRSADFCPEPPAPISRGKLSAAVALIVLYALLAPVVGFALATMGFIAGFMRLSGTRSVPMIAGNTVVGTVLLLYLFVKVVYLPLPKGYGVFEAVTLALYRALHLF